MAENQVFDVNASISKHIGMIKSWIPMHALILAGEYSSEILRGLKINENNTLTVIVGKPKEASHKLVGPNHFFDINKKANTHYWFDVKQYLENSGDINQELQQKISENVTQAIIVASTGEGTGSFMLPTISSQLAERNISVVGFGVLPSRYQAPDSIFNALWSMATCANQKMVQILVDRDGLKEYVGVNRKGELLKGESIFNYLLDMVLSKESFAQEVYEVSKSYGVSNFTILGATGASLKVHGSIENILDAASLKPLSEFEYSSASVLYVLARVPDKLREKCSRGKIEIVVSKWFKEKAEVKAIYVTEPIYVPEENDRIDLILFIGGFNLAKSTQFFNEKVADIVTYADNNGLMKKENWAELVKSIA